MKRVLIVFIFAFLISGGTVGILYQEGIATGIQSFVKQDEVATEADIEAAKAEEQDIAASYGETTTEEPRIGDSEAEIVIDQSADTEAEEAVTDESSADEASAEEASDTGLDETEAADEADKSKEDQEDNSKEDTEKKTSDSDKEAKGPFYSVKVLGYKGGALLMHKNSSGQGDTIGNANIGDTGYMIGSHSTGTRRLCYINGKICYLSKNCTEVTEIDAADYPDALLEVTEKDAGSDFSID